MNITNLNIEESIRKKFKKELLSKFTKAIKQYELIKENDVIACCISGGKDSFLMAKLFQEIKKHKKINFDVIFISMNPGYSDENVLLINENAKFMNIPLNIFETNIFSSVFNIEHSPCYLCARMRRGYLYDFAKKNGANKIALAHHFDDVIETILMSIIYGGQYQTMMPKIKSLNFSGMELIRPMYLIREDDIINWAKYNNLRFLQCACKFTENNNAMNKEQNSKRFKIKHLIKELSKDNKYIDYNIFKSAENVHLNCVLSYKKDDRIYNFLDEY